MEPVLEVALRSPAELVDRATRIEDAPLELARPRRRELGLEIRAGDPLAQLEELDDRRLAPRAHVVDAAVTLGRVWVVALAILLVGLLGDREDGLAAALLAVVLVTAHFIGRFVGHLLDPEEAMERTQDAFVRAWRKLGSFRGESAFSSWLYPLTVNVALSERRSRRRRTSRVFATDDLTPFERPERPRQHEAEFDLEKAMATLPPGARAVFVLHDVEGYKHAEIGQMLGMATGTSKAQLHRARRLLREALEP